MCVSKEHIHMVSQSGDYSPDHMLLFELARVPEVSFVNDMKTSFPSLHHVLEVLLLFLSGHSQFSQRFFCK